MLKWVSDGENLKVLKSRTISDALASSVVSEHIAPYTIWRNKLTVLELERKLREVTYTDSKEPLVPWYLGFSHFERDNEWLVFKRWPVYYIKSWRIRLTQLRQRFGRFIQNIGNRIAQ